MSSTREFKRPTEKNKSAQSGMSLDAEISRRAYELYQERGGENGHDMEDWLRAEQEVRENAGQRRAA